MPFRIALSGLNSFSSSLRSTSNNIANAGTTGFKRARSEFADVYAGSQGTGVQVAANSKQFNQGNIEFTGNTLDMAINGQGFFRMSDNGTTVYTRAGNFHLDREGYITNNQNQRLTGFQADTSGNITGALGELQLDSTGISPGATSRIDLGLNLDARETVPATPFDPNDSQSYNHSASISVYDSLGNQHDMTLYFAKTGDNAFDMHAFVDGNQVLSGSSLQFSSGGQITSPASPAEVTIPAFDPGGGAASQSITIDMQDITQYGSSFSMNSATQDGFGAGNPSTFDISNTGVISARYSNGQSRTIGQVALANFVNPQGLTQLGNTSFGESYDSGTALVGTPDGGSLGALQSGALETSNVDLAEGLIGLILTSHHLQAQMKVIQTAEKTIGSLFDERA